MGNASRISKYLEDFEFLVSSSDDAAKVAKSFWSEGGKYGRNSIETSAMRTTVVSPLSRHKATLEGEYGELKTSKKSQLFEVQNQLKIAEENLAEIPEPPSRDEVVGIDASAADERNSGMSAPSRNDQRDLNRARSALAELRRKNLILEADRRWQAEVDGIQAQRKAARTKISELQSKVDVLNNELVELPDLYWSKWEQAIEVSQFVWSRFVDGYNQGRSSIRVSWRFTKKGKIKAKSEYESKVSADPPSSELGIDDDEPPTFG